MNISTALDTIEETLIAITDGGSSPFLNVFLSPDGWVARIEDPEDSTLPFYGWGPTMEGSEVAIIGLAQHILDHA